MGEQKIITAITTFPSSGGKPARGLTAYVSRRFEAGITRHVWVGQQCIQLQSWDKNITPSGHFYMHDSGHLYFRDAKPQLARHSDGERLVLLHPNAVLLGEIPDDWEVLEGKIEVEMRGPQDSLLRVGDLVFPKAMAA